MIVLSVVIAVSVAALVLAMCTIMYEWGDSCTKKSHRWIWILVGYVVFTVVMGSVLIVWGGPTFCVTAFISALCFSGVGAGLCEESRERTVKTPTSSVTTVSTPPFWQSVGPILYGFSLLAAFVVVRLSDTGFKN